MPDRLIYIISACLLMFIFPLEGQGKSLQGLVKQGNNAYNAGKYDEAIVAYNEALQEETESPYIYFNKGTALYKKGDYTGAGEAFEKAALESKDTSFEAKSKFNLGNSSYKEAETLKDQDLQGALDCCSKSIGHYQDALELDPSLTEAAENIEMVRLIMKNILDEIQKQKEAAKEEQEKKEQAAEELKDIIREQEEALDKTGELEKEQGGDADPGDLEKKINKLVDEQKALRDRTEELSKKWPEDQVPGSQHLENALKEQEAAYGNLDQQNTKEAADNQEEAVRELKEALDSLEKDGNTGTGQKDEEQQDKQEGQQKQASPADENRQNLNEQMQGQEAQANLSDDAQDILNEEKENKEQRRALTIRGYKEVEKDW